MIQNSTDETFYDQLVTRYQGIFKSADLELLSKQVICCAGTGGGSAWTILALARMGIRQK